jgi:aspartyl-tRNA(Asn)/glutamyl-tRNA(Gln) amidotransferase subunit B
MQEGSFRCDANVSVRPTGSDRLGTRCEIKNLNSFRFLEKAIEFEVRRQVELIEDGGTVRQETRLWDPQKGETRSMRSKEDAHDYRYFPDPDLLPLEISPKWIDDIRASLPELPAQMRERFTRDFGIAPQDAVTLTSSREMGEFYERLVGPEGLAGGYKLAASWMVGEFSAALNRAAIEVGESPVGSSRLAGLLRRIADNTISGRSAKDVFDAMWSGDLEADAVIEAKGLRQISDSGAIEALVEQVVAANPKLVEDYRAGREKAFNALVGQVMKASQGKANPAQANAILKAKLS